MQTLYKYIALLNVILFFISKSHAQSLPITSYGVWDRGGGVPDYSDPKADFVKGIETSARWEDIQPNGPATFDFSAFQTILDVAVANNKLIRFSINVGPDCPMWVFDNGVPLVNVISNAPKNDAYANRNPYYPDPEYKIFYFKMIEEFALFLRNQPQEKFDNIAFVQVKTGATGDEEPYKGTVINPIYNITVANWEAFRLEAFAKFKQYFNDVTDRKIVLTFNNVDPVDEPNAYNYVMTQLDPVLGFGIKGGAYNRGHHLSDEQTYKEQWNPFLINPKVSTGNPNGRKLFSASEMDQSWSKGYFALNYEIGFYWSALGGINTGLSCTNISVSAMQYAFANPGIIEIFKMYNRYAQQVYPATATTAFSVFHEGLNSADTVKFPESIYGNASKTNLTRYQNICNDPKYANRGARIDDPIAVVKGQVFQREDQEFYNDAGWEICEGNIERFMTQINPDATSIGLFRVRGTITATSSKYDRFARSFENSTGKNTMYFQLHNELPATNKNLKFTIIWLDKTAGSTWAFKYRNSAGLQTIPFTGTGTNQWRTEIFNVIDGVMDQGGVNGSDFMLVNTDTVNDIFNGIEMNILGVGKQAQTINFNPLPFKKVGDADFSPGATASSGLAVTYTSSNTNAATIVNNMIHVVGLGVTTITASQAGNNGYDPATSVQDLTVVNQTIKTTVGNSSWVAPAGVTSVIVECWGAGGSGGSTSSGGVGGGGGGGSYVINQNVTVVPGTSYTVTVGAGGVASSSSTTNGTAGGNSQFLSTVPVIANGGVIGANAIGTGVSNTAFGLGGINTVGGSGGTVTIGGSGADAAASSGGKGGNGAGSGGGAGGAADTVATGAGNPGSSPGGGGSGAFGAAIAVRVGGNGGNGQVIISYTLSAPKSNQTITFNALPTKTVGDADFNPGATASSGLTVSYVSSNTAVATIVGGNIHIVGAGTATITASQAGDATYNAATSLPQTLTVNKINQTITFNSLPTKTVGDADFNPGATASSGLTVSYVSSNTAVATIVSGLIHIVGAGTATITASQAGDANYNTAVSVNQSLTVSKSNQTITFNALPTKTVGNADFNPGATASSGLTVSYVSSNTAVATIVSGLIHIVGAGTSTITASQAGDTNYNAATNVSQTLTVTAGQVVTTYAPTSFTVLLGTKNTGTITRLATNDGNVMVFNSSTSSTRSSDWYCSTAISQTPSSITKLTINYDGKNSISRTQILYLYNWPTSSWTQIDSRTVSTTDVLIINIQNSPVNFISPTGEIRLRVYSSGGNKSYTCSADWVSFTVENSNGLRLKPETTKTVSSDDTKKFKVFPNPAAGFSAFEYSIPEEEKVQLSIYNLSGQMIKTIVNNETHLPGNYTKAFDVGSLGNGVYVAQLKFGNQVQTIKVIVKN
nr:T9SS type A sorting domain-containing protein [uncultured Flavobacterium sp.]